MKKLTYKAFAIAFITVFAAAFCLIPQTASAASNFIIEDYDIHVEVNENDTYEVTETIKVHFTAPSHGIYRSIPLKTTLDRDGQKSTYFAKVKDFEMISGENWEDESDGGDFIARIGKEDELAKTDTVYKLQYTYDTRGDHFKGGDEVYYNFVGTAWEAQSIDHVSFDMVFPKPIDMGKVGIKTGDNEYVDFEAVSDTEIKGETSEYVLDGLTIRAVLPEGYFTRQEGSGNIPLYIISALMLLMAGAGFRLWRKYGVDPEIVETEEFYPPKKLSAPEVGYLNEGEIQESHVISSLLSLADRGYIRIAEIETTKGKKKKKTKTSYEITKVREYDENIIGERAFMDGLFKDGDSVRLEDLENKFYETVDEIENKIEKHYQNKLYDKTAAKYASILKYSGIAGLVLLELVSLLTGSMPASMGGEAFKSILYSGGITLFLFITGFSGITKKINQRAHYGGIIGYAGCIFVGLVLCVLFDVAPGIRFIPFVIGLGACFVLFFMSALCEKKTEWYASTLGKIRGYKNFLEVAEKDKMEALAEEDPQYFYKNLAFAFALGVTAVYAEHFASLATKPPDWYTPRYGYADGNALSSMAFVDSVDSIMESISDTMTSSPSNGGGGGSFSGGGGGGGGGGGSW